MSKKTNTEIIFTPSKSLRKSDVNRHARNSENNKTTLSGCKHLSAIDELMNSLQTISNFSHPKKKRVEKVKHCKRKRS
jgi:hypothetical protein